MLKGHKRCTIGALENRGAREGHERCTRGARDVHERGTRGAFMGIKVETVFFILTHLGRWCQRCTKGEKEGHKRCAIGAREWQKRGTRGA